jgi:hypothetical protein
VTDPVDRPTGDYVPGRDGRDDDELIVDDRYFTRAVESGVVDDGETVGHVTLLDLDDSGIETARQAARQLPGATAVVRSSELSYHVWELSVATIDETVDRADRLDGVDPDHVGLTAARGCWVVRTEPKRRLDDATEIKPAPRVVAWDAETHPELTHSRPHLRELAQLPARDGVEIEVPEVPLVGDSCETRLYMAEIGGGSGVDH